MKAESANTDRSRQVDENSLNYPFTRRAAIALLSLAVALLLRLSLDPILHDSLPLVTLYGAVAIAAWHCRWPCAASISLLGYGLASYLFGPLRDKVPFGLSSLVAFVSYAISCAIIIYTGERMNRAHDRMRALEAGYQIFVPKPIEAGELCAVVANLVNGNDDLTS